MSDAINLLQNDPLDFIIVVIAVVSLFSLFIFAIYFNFIPAKIASQYRQIRERPLMYFGLLGIILALILISIAFLFIVAGSGPKMAAKVGGESITLDSVEKLATDCSISNKESVELLVDDKVLAAWAKEENIEFSKKELEEELSRIGGKGRTDICFQLKARVSLHRERLYLEIEDYREGKLIVVNFSRYNPSGFYTSSLSDAKREKLRKEERAYADKLIQSIYSDLKSNKITFEQGIQKAKNDPRVGVNSWYATSPQSKSFSAVEYIKRQSFIRSSDIRQKIDSLATGQFSEPFVQSVTDDTLINSKPIETRWFIVKVERKGKGIGGSIEGLLDQTRADYGGKIYL